MSEMMSPPPPVYPENAPATFPMMSDTDGKIAPAIKAAKMPNPSKNLSYGVM